MDEEGLRRENLVLRARIIQLTNRVLTLEAALGGLRPYKTVKVPADDRFKQALKKLDKKEPDE